MLSAQPQQLIPRASHYQNKQLAEVLCDLGNLGIPRIYKEYDDQK